MKRTGLLAAVLLCALLLGALAGCGAQSPEEQILGKWVFDADPEQYMIFYDDYNVVDDYGNTARWFIEGDTLSIIDPWYGAEEGRYELSGDTLRIYTEDGVAILRRAG